MNEPNPFTCNELILLACAKDLYKNFKGLTEELVINICLEKRYLTRHDIEQESKEYLFIKRVFKRVYPAMLLFAPKIEPASEPEDYQRLLKQLEEFAEAIIQSMSKTLMNAQTRPPR